MIRAWVIGFMILFAVDIMVVISILTEVYPRVLLRLLQISPFIAAFVLSYLAPRKKIIMGTSIAIPASVLLVVFNFAYQLSGREVDSVGLKGGLIFFGISLLYSVILCALGGALGYFTARKKKKLGSNLQKSKKCENRSWREPGVKPSKII